MTSTAQADTAWRATLGRRATGAALLAATWRPGPAAALVVPAPTPCRRDAADIVGLTVAADRRRGAPEGTVASFGHAFRPGDVPADARLLARLTTGREIPVQIDISARHADGSARFAALAFPLPALPPGARLPVMLATVRAGAPAAEPLDMVAALARHRLVLTVAPSVPGNPWRVDLTDALHGALAAGTARLWRGGPWLVEARIALPVPVAAAGGVLSLRLIADLAASSDGNLAADLWLRNDIAMRPGGGPARYAVRVEFDGREALATGPLIHRLYQAWGRQLGAADRPPPTIQHDPAYLAATGAVVPYARTGVAAATLAGFARAAEDPAWRLPLGNRELTQYMPSTGARPEIGPTTAAQAAWLMTGDAAAAAYAIGQAEAGGSVPWHLFDPQAAGGAGGWLDLQRWPRLWIDPRGGRPPGGLLQPIPDDTGWTPDTAHQPDLAFVPYLLTARRALLDQLQAQAARAIMAQWPSPRGDGVGILVRLVELRGGAWSLRQVENAAWASPDGSPERAYFRRVAHANWAYLRGQLPTWTEQQGEAHGRFPGETRNPSEAPPWQQDFFASTAALAARRGSADAREVLRWSGNFLAGRFLSGDAGFPPATGFAYSIAVAPEAPEGAPPYRSWAEIGAATRRRGMAVDGGVVRDTAYFAQVARASLGLLVTTLGSAPARRALDWLNGPIAPFIAPTHAARELAFDIVPPPPDPADCVARP